MNTINMTLIFNDWLLSLKDIRGRARIVARINAAEEGNFGDCAPVGEGVSEMRVHFGPGYRLYFAQEGKTVYLLLVGGDKKTQTKDVQHAKELWRQLKEDRR